MDRNGYGKSLFDTHDGICYFCHRHVDTARHEIFGGTRNRQISKLTGMWVCLCPRCHEWATQNVHYNRETTFNRVLQDKAEQLFRNTYSMDFNHVMMGALKNWEIDQLKDEVRARERRESW